jgi:restriction system protein
LDNNHPKGFSLERQGNQIMTVWLIRAGKNGEREELALKSNVAAVGWEEMPDLTPCTTREALRDLLNATYPDYKPKTISNWESQLWPIRDTIKKDDIVVLPLKTRSDVAIGKVTGTYQYRTDLASEALHTVPVKWLAEFPRSAFDKDLLFSFGAFMTVCRIERNNAEARILAKLKGKAIKLPQSQEDKITGEIDTSSVDATDQTAFPDLEQHSADLIRERIAQRFKGHELTNLVSAILETQGYRTRVSPPGADGGVDITAGSGPLGFDAPRLIAQVKSQDSKVDVKVLRELKGTMTKYHADHALLVGWGGFTGAAVAEATADYFKVRLWEAADIVRAAQENYSGLPEAIRAEMPLKQVWVLVPGESEV